MEIFTQNTWDNQSLEEALKRGEPCLIVVRGDQLEIMADDLGIHPRIVGECLASTSSKMESHEGFDFIALNVPNRDDLFKPYHRTCIYYRKNLMMFVCDGDRVVDGIVEALKKGELEPSLDRVFYSYFDQLTVGDAVLEEDIEQEISDLEEALLTSEKQDCTREIVLLRRKLMALKRYYEQLLEISEMIEENGNGLVNKRALRYFRMLTGRVNRLYHGVMTLRDYVTQVRESYQAQVDISLNRLMKLFTVITAVCLPLTLIAGWYGMNFDMPEYRQPWAYPALIVISIAVVAVCIYHFRKNKWL